MSANDTQVGGAHYQTPIQPWDFIVNGLGFLEGNIVKYVTRWKQKGGVEDLRKARHYLDKLIEVHTPIDEAKELNEQEQQCRAEAMLRATELAGRLLR